jgi:hypothetical protein
VAKAIVRLFAFENSGQIIVWSDGSGDFRGAKSTSTARHRCTSSSVTRMWFDSPAPIVLNAFRKSPGRCIALARDASAGRASQSTAQRDPFEWSAEKRQPKEPGRTKTRRKLSAANPRGKGQARAEHHHREGSGVSDFERPITVSGRATKRLTSSVILQADSEDVSLTAL